MTNTKSKIRNINTEIKVLSTGLKKKTHLLNG